jgi:hypothetical protein
LAAASKQENIAYCMKQKQVVININTKSKQEENGAEKANKDRQFMQDCRTMTWTAIEQKYPAQAFDPSEKLQKIRMEQIQKI